MTRVMLNRRMLAVRQRARQEARIREEQALAEDRPDVVRDPHAPEAASPGRDTEGH